MNTAKKSITELILETVPEGIAWKDENSVYRGANTQFAKAAGFNSPQDIIGKTDDQLAWKEFASDYIASDKEVLDSGQSILHRVEFYHRQDEPDVWLDLSLLPFKHEGDIGILIVFQDITKAMEEKQELHTLKNTAIEANKAKSLFLSRMSHELRTPMNAILGFSQLLDSDTITEDQHENVKEILKAGEHLLELINEVLDLSKIESGKFDLLIEAIELNDVVKECISLMNPIAEQDQIEIIDNITTSSRFIINGDRLRLKQVILNLFSNAIKYNRKHGRVTLTYMQLAIEERKIRINFIDTGFGMTQKQLALLFQPFERLSAKNTDITGTGIGLVITKKLVELMGGTIGVTSEVGEGSCFWLDLPLNKLKK